MLKKLVKYGNSHALILDKAILELLNIEEGSVVKIKTDGKSIIITPSPTTNKIIFEPLTQDRAYIESIVNEFLKKQDVNIEMHKIIKKELYDILKKHQDLTIQLHQNPEFTQKLADLTSQIDISSPVYMQEYKALIRTFNPELLGLEKQLAELSERYSLPGNTKQKSLQSGQSEHIEQQFIAIHKKYSDTYKAYSSLLNNPEYQHKAQLIAEKYRDDQDSDSYLKSMQELNRKYIPDLLCAQEELKTVAEQYTNFIS